MNTPPAFIGKPDRLFGDTNLPDGTRWLDGRKGRIVRVGLRAVAIRFIEPEMHQPLAEMSA